MLQGKRVRLRSIGRDDLPRQLAFNNSLEIELAGGGDPPLPQSLERLQADFDSAAGKGGRDGPSFGIEADGQFIGQCALFNIDAVARTCELGITIGDPAYLDRGYGREAIALLVGYAFTHHNMHRAWLRVHATNLRAQRAYAACGFVEEGRLRSHVWSDGHYDDLVTMGLLREDWRRSAPHLLGALAKT
ncbi:MAG: GNAT family protein [Devosia sp.]|nr:GNAT family protein [Devosia sp.]